MYIPHSIYPFIQQWVLGLLPHWATVNSAAVNMGVRVPTGDLAFSSLGYVFRSGVAGSYGSSSFNFGGSSILFSVAAAPVLIPTNNAGAFFFLHILTDTHHFLGSVGL